MANVPLPAGSVQTYAPAVKFHVDEQNFPCSIEYLMKGGKLEYRRWNESYQIASQQTITPALVSFQNSLYIIYSAASDNEVWVTSSSDGTNWTTMQKIGQQAKTLAAAAFQGQLWLVCSAVADSQLYVTSSSDGLTWSAPRQLPNQKGTVPALAVYDSQLVVCYRSSVSNQMYWTRSSDGSNWRFEVMPFQAASGFPSMTVISGTGGISQLLLVCAASAAGSQLLQSIYTPSSGWAALAPIVSQSAQSVSLTTTSDGAAFMTYLGMGSPAQYYASTSTDGIKWTFSPIDNQIGNSPACYTFQGRTYMVYTSPGSPGQLNVTSAQGSIIAPFPPILNPTQSDLANCGSDPNFWININDAQWRAGNQPGANTLYYAIQQDATHWYIHYLFLYAGQRGQTVRSLFPLAQFNAQLWSVGEHPGDLERVMMKLNKSPDGTSVASIEGVQYEAHGNFHDYTFDQVDWIDGTHALVSVALNNHSNWNEKIEGSPVADNNIPLVALIGNFLGGSFGDTSIMWNPYSDAGTTFTELGIDADGKPINDQIWATFRGRMGDSYVTSLKGGSSFGGVDLSTFDWGYVETIWSIAVAKGIVSGGLLHADGPGGPGGRAWVTPLSS